MTFWQQLAHPYNLCYTVSIGLVVFFVSIQLVGVGLTEWLGLDITANDLDAAPPSATGAVAGGWLMSGLLFFHGRSLPASLIIYLLFVVFGFCGLALDSAGRHILGWHDHRILMSLPIALLSSVLLTKALTAILALVVPTAPPVPEHLHLIGGMARAIKSSIDQRPSQAVATTHAGQSLIISCRMDAGEPPVPVDHLIQLIRYDEHERLFICRKALHE